MSNYDDRSNNEADQHSRMMQEQRKDWAGSAKQDKPAMLKYGTPAVTDEEMTEIDELIKTIANYEQSNTRQAMWTVVGLTLIALIVIYLSWGGL